MKFARGGSGLAATAAVFIAAPAWLLAHDIPGAPGGATYYRDVAPLLQAHCQRCHHDGGGAPFNLLTYEDARSHSGAIEASTKYGTMPPVSVRLGAHEFEGPRRLRDAEIAVFEDWVGDDLQKGDVADAPPPLEFRDEEWKLGEPDVVLTNVKRGYRVPANPTPGVHSDRFQCFYVPTRLDADRWITGIEVLPGSDAVVHHVLMYLDVEHKSKELDRRYPGPGYENYSGVGFDAPVILSWNPGAPPVQFAPGVGFKIPRGAALALQIHYAYAAEPAVDKTRIGLHFARSPVSKARFVIQPKNQEFVIPANVRGTRIDARMVLTEDLTADTVTPHQHRLGYEIAVEAVRPGGSIDELIHVDWDVFHQGTYVFRDPVSLPAGTELHVWGLYDNTAENTLNPNSPPVDVSWGRESFNEMLFSFLGVTRDAETLTVGRPELASVSMRGGRLTGDGAGFMDGALVEIDGKLMMDSRVTNGSSRVASRRARKAMKHLGHMTVRVLNPDGSASNTVEIEAP